MASYVYISKHKTYLIDSQQHNAFSSFHTHTQLLWQIVRSPADK